LLFSNKRLSFLLLPQISDSRLTHAPPSTCTNHFISLNHIQTNRTSPFSIRHVPAMEEEKFYQELVKTLLAPSTPPGSIKRGFEGGLCRVEECYAKAKATPTKEWFPCPHPVSCGDARCEELTFDSFKKSTCTKDRCSRFVVQGGLWYKLQDVPDPLATHNPSRWLDKEKLKKMADAEKRRQGRGGEIKTRRSFAEWLRGRRR
jgi:hypothetical protein